MNKKVDKSTPIPRYYQVYSSLLERIKKGEFSEQQPLPSERKLTEEYGVSRITIVKAMDLLKNEGIIDRQHGRGTFIRAGKLANDPTEQLSLSDNLTQQGLKPEWKILKKDWYQLSDKVARALKLSGQKAHFRVTLQLLANGQPIGYHQMQITADHARAINAEHLDDSELIQYFREYPAKNKLRVERGFEALPAGEDEVKLLNVAANDPVLMVDLIYKNQDNEVIEFIRSYFRADSFRYNV